MSDLNRLPGSSGFLLSFRFDFCAVTRIWNLRGMWRRSCVMWTVVFFFILDSSFCLTSSPRGGALHSHSLLVISAFICPSVSAHDHLLPYVSVHVFIPYEGRGTSLIIPGVEWFVPVSLPCSTIFSPAVCASMKLNPKPLPRSHAAFAQIQPVASVGT